MRTPSAPDAGDASTLLQPNKWTSIVKYWIFILLFMTAHVARAQVVINEIMYRPAPFMPEDTRHEWIELHNTGTNAVDLAGWRLSKGVHFTFGNTIVQPGGYLVVAADTAAFMAKYPAVTNVVGGWDGVLSNNGEDINLDNASGQREDSVRYANEGDWGIRARGPLDRKHYGWIWTAGHDGAGRSLELINPQLSNNHGQNWSASLVNNGTPGSVNSVWSTNVAPMILDGAHLPLIPSSSDSVVIRARILDEMTTGITATVHYRNASSASPPAFSAAPMFDDGQHGDGAAGDGVYGAILPPQPASTVIEFYLSASDAVGNSRTWPAPARDTGGSLVQTVNLLYQVDDSTYTGTQPIYRLIMTETERAELAQIGSIRQESRSQAQMNGTFISHDGTGAELRYTVGIRNRGNSSASRPPHGYRVNFRNDRKWKGVSAINLNTQFTHSQLAGSAFFQKAGLVTQDARAVQVRVNSANLIYAGTPSYGIYVCNEVQDSDYADHHFPLDANGNMYRGVAIADLSYLGADPGPYRSGYFKRTKASADDWSDLIQLTHALSTNTPDASYVATVQSVVDIDQWLRFFAINVLMDNTETSISNGEGDDYALYRGESDPRFRLLPYDLDSILGAGGGSTTAPLFQATNAPAVDRFMKHPALVPRYYGQLKQLIDTTFSPEQFNPFVEQVLSEHVPVSLIDSMKTFIVGRNAFVLSQIPLSLTVTSALPILHSYHHTTDATAALSGTANAIETRSVLVNGIQANWSALEGKWELDGIALQPGINRVLVQSINEAGQEFERTHLDVWHDTGGGTTVSGTLSSSSSTWTAAAGPFRLTGDIIVPVGTTLVIEPGTTIYFAGNARLIVQGGLLAEGSDTQRIRLTREPGATGVWGGIHFQNSTEDNRLTFVDMDFAGATAQSIRVENSRLLIEHCTWSNTDKKILELSNASLAVRYCIFPQMNDDTAIQGSGIPSGGYVIIEGNRFGRINGVGDAIRFAGGQRPGPILQVLDNFFAGGGDDAIDLNGADAHIEGNRFQQFSKETPGIDPSAAITAAGGSEITAARNVFAGNDHAVILTGGSFLVGHNNTIAGSAVAGISFAEPDMDPLPGSGATLTGHIHWNDAVVFKNVSPTNGSVSLTINHSLLPGASVWPGTGNVNGDPRFLNASNDFHLRPGSPALSTGPNGLDMGAHVPAGASVSGEPTSLTSRTSATLIVGGPGITHFKYRVNGGSYSSELSIGNQIELTGLTNGSYTVQVLGKNSAGIWQAESNTTVSRTWTVDTGRLPVRINEVLARNVSAVNHSGTFPDLIELYNEGSTAFNLSGMRLSDNPANPTKFTFPAGTTIGPGAYLVLYADSATTPGIHLGFSLSASGESVSLYASDGTLIDSVFFGPQLNDLSIGRLPDGSWTLTQPTFGSVNVAQATGDPARLKINEWLADGQLLLADDFIELYNPDSLPVDLGGLFLTDNPQGAPGLHEIAPLSFIGGGSVTLFTADGRPDRGPDHLNFKLSPNQGFIGLFDRQLNEIDLVYYGPQQSDVSQGRTPNGSTTLTFFQQPTPGSPNAATTGTNGTVVLNEILAVNASFPDANGVASDFVELYNPTTNAIDLAEMSLSDNTLSPRRWVFPPGSTIPALGHLVVRCNGNAPASTSFGSFLNTGFGLSANGDAVFLFDAPVRGGAMLDSVRFGVQAVDFSIARIPNGSGEWQLGLPSPAGINIPAVMGNVLAVKINEWMASPASGEDWFELFNPNTQPVAIGGMFLSDDLNNSTKHPIAPLSFIGTGLDAFRKFIADDLSSLGADHVSFKLNGNNGEAIGLFAGNGTQIDAVTFGPQQAGVSQGRLPDGAATIHPFPDSATPGSANYLFMTNVVINEVLTHSDWPLEDAIELRNLTDQPIDLSGWYLSDNVNNVRKYQIPPDTIIPAQGFRAFYENAFNSGEALIPFALNSARGDSVYLSAADSSGNLTGYRAFVVVGPAANGISFGRHVTSVGVDFVALSSPTFGVDNPVSVEHFRTGTGAPNAYPLVGPVVINELMYHPPTVGGSIDNSADEFIELRNITTDTVPLYDPYVPTNRWRIAGGVNFTFPPGVNLLPSGCLLVVSFDPSTDPAALDAFRARFGVSTNTAIFGPFLGKLNNSGERVELYKPDPPQTSGPDTGFVPYVLVEAVHYSPTAPWPVGASGSGSSLQRLNGSDYGNDPANWTTDLPTAGRDNNSDDLDSDGDGLPDWWEDQHGFDKFSSSDADEDADGDGMTNFQEFLAGTDPHNAASKFEIFEWRVENGTDVVLEWSSVPGRSYRVQHSSDLIAWQDATLPVVAAGSSVQFTDALAARRFYRVLVE